MRTYDEGYVYEPQVSLCSPDNREFRQQAKGAVSTQRRRGSPICKIHAVVRLKAFK